MRLLALIKQVFLCNLQVFSILLQPAAVRAWPERSGELGGGALLAGQDYLDTRLGAASARVISVGLKVARLPRPRLSQLKKDRLLNPHQRQLQQMAG